MYNLFMITMTKHFFTSCTGIHNNGSKNKFLSEAFSKTLILKYFLGVLKLTFGLDKCE